MKNLQTTFFALIAAAALVACGGSPKKPGGSGSGSGDNPDAANPDGTIDVAAKAVKQVPKRKVSKDARKDFIKAVEFHKAQSKDGWTNDSCNAIAGKWAEVAGEHGKLVEARYNAGMAFHRCGMLDKAEDQYKKALKIVRGHAPSLSNLGEIKFARGKVRAAKADWQRALKADAKLVAARNNLAWLMLKDLRETKDRSTWKRLEKSARDQLSSVLAVDQKNTRAYVLYGLVYLEGSERNKNRLDLAKLLLDEAKKHNANYAPLQNAYGLLYMRRKSPGVALEKFLAAVKLDGEFSEARMNVGNITLNFRKYSDAEEQFTAVLSGDTKNYDAHIGLGIAQRGLNKLDEAEASYNAALKQNAKRGDAFYNLGVLYKDFRANKASDLKESIAMYKKAKGYFNKFLSKPKISRVDRDEAKANIKDCDKTVKQIRNAMKAMEAVKAAEEADAAIKAEEAKKAGKAGGDKK